MSSFTQILIKILGSKYIFVCLTTYLECFLQNLRAASSLTFQFKFYTLKKPVLVILIIILKIVSDRFLFKPVILKVRNKAGTLSNVIPLVLGGGERCLQMSNSLYLFCVLTFHKVLISDKH